MSLNMVYYFMPLQMGLCGFSASNVFVHLVSEGPVCLLVAASRPTLV